MTRKTGAGALAGKVLAFACALGFALAGCARPEPEPYVPSETSTPTPAPTRDAEQARAINAVQSYLDVTTEIGQNLETANWSRVFEVADEAVADSAWTNWAYWLSDGLHLVGSPTITVDSVVLGYFDSQSEQYRVRVCSDRTNVHLVDAEGDQMPGGASNRFLHEFTVLVSDSGVDLVIAEAEVGGTC